MRDDRVRAGAPEVPEWLCCRFECCRCVVVHRTVCPWARGRLEPQPSSGLHHHTSGSHRVSPPAAPRSRPRDPVDRAGASDRALPFGCTSATPSGCGGCCLKNRSQLTSPKEKLTLLPASAFVIFTPSFLKFKAEEEKTGIRTFSGTAGARLLSRLCYRCDLLSETLHPQSAICSYSL